MDTETLSSGTAADRWRHFLLFARNFIRSPLSVGTFLPSSSYVVERVVEQIDWQRAKTVIEFGAGLGTISSALLERMPAQGRLLLIETNAEFAAHLQQTLRDHRVIVAHGSAADVADLMQQHRLGQADVVVSGIPFTTLPRPVRERILAATAEVLAQDGQFVVYQYTRAVLRHLRGRFEVRRSTTEWRNTWPARIFDCRPERGSGEADGAVRPAAK
jgi:phosphatidylethanolamine/phosphatidyl-N-methylethanolamine N-methyltransferase